MDIENINYPAPKQEYKVLVRCFTYNQSKYIEDALNGFAMQQTNFPFVCLVMDDASTDGEQEVIKAWMERECDMTRAETIDIPTSVVMIVPHIANASCTFAFYLLKQNLYGTGKKEFYVTPWREKCQYEAICEGDDYWIDPLKLQQQVDVLDRNPEYTLSFTNIEIFNEESKTYDKNPLNAYLNDVLPDEKERLFYYIITNLCRIQTLTVVYDVRYLSKIKSNSYKFMMGDTPLWLDLSQYGKFHYLSCKTGVYRVYNGSASRNNITLAKFRLSMFEMRIYYCNKYGYEVPKRVKHEYNRAAINLILENSCESNNLLYPLYKMNALQNIMVNKANEYGYIKNVISIISKIELFIYMFFRRITIVFQKVLIKY